MKLLIVEDEADMLSALRKGFFKMGYAVDTADDGNHASYLIQVNDYDVIVLDLNLPNKDGFEILREIRSKSQTQKVIILSARSSVTDKINGLDYGANDYLSKPFNFLELEARIRSLARRDFIQKESIITVNELTVDTSKKSAYVKEIELELSPKEYGILEYLIINCGKVISSEELIEHIWESDVDLFKASTKVHISNLRKKIMSICGTEIIKTVRGYGYIIEKEK